MDGIIGMEGEVPTVQRCIERNFIKEDFSDICVLG